MESTVADDGVIVLTVRCPRSGFLYRSTPPHVLVDGVPVRLPGWGNHPMPVSPGRHRVEVYVPYVLPRKVGLARTVVAVAPGQEVRLAYRAPSVIFTAGWLGSRRERIFRWLSVAVRATAFVAAVFVAGWTIIGWQIGTELEDPIRERGPDPRAVIGSESDITLEETIAEHDLILPGDARQIKYKTRNDNSYFLYITFVSSCDSAGRFIRYSGLPRTMEPDVDGVSYEIDQAADTVEVPAAQRAPQEFYGDDTEGRWGSRQRLGEGIGGGVCRTIFYAIDDEAMGEDGLVPAARLPEVDCRRHDLSFAKRGIVSDVSTNLTPCSAVS